MNGYNANEERQITLNVHLVIELTISFQLNCVDHKICDEKFFYIIWALDTASSYVHLF